LICGTRACFFKKFLRIKKNNYDLWNLWGKTLDRVRHLVGIEIFKYLSKKFGHVFSSFRREKIVSCIKQFSSCIYLAKAFFRYLKIASCI